MEQQVVTKTVSGHMLSLPSLVSVIAAANPKWGQWDEGHGVVENINFEPYLLTRFDIVHCSIKTNSIKKQAIAAKILKLDPVTTEQSIKPLMSETELLQYINYCKQFNPKLTKGAKKMLNEFYQQMSEITEDEDKVVPMTPRELEALIRLTTARAKLLQRKEATTEDVEAIIKLKKTALDSFPGITVKGEGTQLKLLSELDKKEKTKEGIILECMDEEKKVQSKEVCDRWVEAGIYKTEQKAQIEFQKMIGNRFYLRSNGYIYK